MVNNLMVWVKKPPAVGYRAKGSLVLALADILYKVNRPVRLRENWEVSAPD